MVLDTTSNSHLLTTRLNLIPTDDHRLIEVITLGMNTMSMYDFMNQRVIAEVPATSNSIRADGRYWIYTYYPTKRIANWVSSISVNQKLNDELLQTGREVHIVDTKSGDLAARFPAAFWYANFTVLMPENVLAYYSYDDGTIQLWDFVPRRRAPRGVAWSMFVLALVATRWWWRTRKTNSTPCKNIRITSVN
jgi:hypothetical protein